MSTHGRRPHTLVLVPATSLQIHCVQVIIKRIVLRVKRTDLIIASQGPVLPEFAPSLYMHVDALCFIIICMVHCLSC